MKVKLTSRSKEITTEEYEVEFPIYSRSVVSDHADILMKRISATQTLQITANYDGTMSLELDSKDDMENDHSGADYHLGRGIYACTKENFEETFREALEKLTAFESGPLGRTT